MEFYSCDTMVALGNSTKTGNVIFAKNSDRPVTEAQPLVIFPAADYNNGAMVKCTYIEIPQVKHTYRVLGSKPYWIWGFEHGMNECNVVIGNEAVWAREAESKKEALLGMDLVRLALERGNTAYNALHIIIDLLTKYGQGGNAAIGREHYYNNSFLIADPNEAWVLDTCGYRWVARKVKDVAGISNCYSTEEEWDEECGDIMEYAYRNNWIDKDVPFNFAKAYGAMTIKHRAAYPRFARLNKLLNMHKGNITLQTMKSIQRDHFEGEIIAPRWNPADCLQVSICMHAMSDIMSKTAAASHIEILKESQSTWWHAFSVPCMSIFAPYTVQNNIPQCISNAGEKYSEDSVWWKFERLQYAIEQDYEKYFKNWRDEADKLEKLIYDSTIKSSTLDDDTIENNTKILLDAIEKEYQKIISSTKNSTSQPQHKEMNECAKKRAGIVF